MVAPAKVLYSTLADMNGDGWSDLVVSCEGGTVNIALNRGGAVQEVPGTLLVFPNPARRWFTVRSGVPGAYTLRLYNAAGQLVKEVWRSGASGRVQVPQLPGGLYYVQVVAGESREVRPLIIHN